NGVPMDRPGHYIYLRDDDTGEYYGLLAPLQRGARRVSLPPRAELQCIRVPPQRRIRIAHDVHPPRRGGGAVGRNPAKPLRSPSPPERVFLCGVLLSSNPYRQPEFSDVPLLRRLRL